MSSSRGLDPVRLELGAPGPLIDRIDAALKAKGANVPRSDIEDLLTRGGIRWEGSAETTPVAFIDRPIPDETTVTLTVLYEDEDLVVIDKPSGLATTPQGSFVARSVLVQARRQIDDGLAPAHRLDRATSGVLIFTRPTERRGYYQSQFESHLDKVYEFLSPLRFDGGVISSRIVPGENSMIEIEGPPNAETEIRLLGRSGDLWRYEARPVTGRTHQIRLHARRCGAPISGDTLYAGGDPPDSIALHAREITIMTPHGARTLSSTPPWSG